MTSRDQRAEQRHPLLLRVDRVGGSSFAAETENLSASGLFIRSDREVPVGSRIPLLVGFRGLLAPVEIEVEVVRARPAAEGQPGGIAVRIPEDRPEDRARLARIAAGASRTGPAQGRAFRLLVVEDNPLVEAAYDHALRHLRDPDGRLDIAIEFAHDGAEALSRLAREPAADLVLADLYMPGMDGFEMVSKIRADPRLRDVPVVAISGGNEEARARALRVGVDVYLRKPVKIQDILGTVRALLQIDG